MLRPFNVINTWLTLFLSYFWHCSVEAQFADIIYAILSVLSHFGLNTGVYQVFRITSWLIDSNGKNMLQNLLCFSNTVLVLCILCVCMIVCSFYVVSVLKFFVGHECEINWKKNEYLFIYLYIVPLPCTIASLCCDQWMLSVLKVFFFTLWFSIIILVLVK